MKNHIELTHSWKQTANIAIVALEAGTSEGKAIARAEIRKMSEILDEINATAKNEA